MSDRSDSTHGRATRSARARRTAALTLLAFLTLVPLPLAAQHSELLVEVTDAAGKKLADVRVTVTQEATSFSYEGVTNKKGKHTVAIKDSTGSYLLRLEKAGLATYEDSIELQPGTSMTAKIALIDQELRNRQLAVEAFNTGVTLLESGKEDEALARFNEAAELDGTLAEAQRLIALLAATAGDIDAAGAALEHYLELEPTGLLRASPAAYVVYRHRDETDRLPEVRSYLQQIGAAKDLATRIYNEGVKQVKEGDPDAARETFEESLRLNPELAPAYQSLAALHFNEQRYAEALPYLDKLLAVVPTHGQGLRMAFFSNLMLEHHSAAVEVGKKWFAASSTADDELLKQADRHFQANQNNDASRLLRAVVEIDPTLPLVHFQLGKLLAAGGEIAEAKEHLQRFLDLDPSHAEAEAARQMLQGL